MKPAAHRDHLPFVATGPRTARRPAEGEACETCGLPTTYQSTGTIEIGMFVVDLDTKQLWSEGRRLPAVKVIDNWRHPGRDDDELVVVTGPYPGHMPELFAYFPLENGAWADLHVHTEEPEMTLYAGDPSVAVHVVWGPDSKTPIASTRCGGVAGECYCPPYVPRVYGSRSGCMVTAVIIDTDDVFNTLAAWGSLDIPGLEEAKARGQANLERWNEEEQS